MPEYVFGHWWYYAVAFMAVILYMAYMRRMEMKRIYDKFGEDNILLTSLGVNYFGLESEPGRPRKSTGALALTTEGLYYRARFRRLEVTIPGNLLTAYEVITEHKGRPLHQKVLGFLFVNEKGEKDRAAFRIPYPERWVAAIDHLFLKRETGSDN